MTAQFDAGTSAVDRVFAYNLPLDQNINFLQHLFERRVITLLCLVLGGQLGLNCSQKIQEQFRVEAVHAVKKACQVVRARLQLGVDRHTFDVSVEVYENADERGQELRQRSRFGADFLAELNEECVHFHRKQGPEDEQYEIKQSGRVDLFLVQENLGCVAG